MRLHSLLLLAAAFVVAACDDGPGPSTDDGTLVVSTATGGDDPDPNGYRVTVDGLDTLALPPSGSAELQVAAGAHTLRLLGVAEHCTVAPGASLEVEVEPGSRTAVGFAVDCPATGVLITMVSTGLDFDPDGYRITVDGVARGRILPNGTVRLILAPGNRTIGVTDLARNCAIEDFESQAVTIVDREVVPLEFAAICTAATGAIGVVVAAAGVDQQGEYVATVDGSFYTVQLGQPTYLTRIPPGDHVVSLRAPANCSVETEPQSVTLTAGGMVRDTAEVSFSVSCTTRLGTLRVTALTTGTPSPYDYTVSICDSGFYCSYPYVGPLDPNGTLVAQVHPGSYEIWLDDVPATCAIQGPAAFQIELSDTVHVHYQVSCP